ncbi:hypothetical protein KPH14_012835 [Odynerus spinipes]|uniref:PiggyBac transposable element-derived protein domain-containing protein n=1 Tax=Odynerus spinipes TaxID=1348599 RepID=A0AAD9VL52_9HYME|nr:hypothetical protein KPH14_012835 [Odynerus spinipes]
MYKKRRKVTKKASNSHVSNSSEKATNVSSSQSKDIDRVINSDENSSDSSVIMPVVNRRRRPIIYDSDEEENTRHEVTVKWNWKETNNRPIIWKYSESPGVKDYVLNQLGANHGLLDLFFVVFDENFWDILVTQTNLYAKQIMNDERRRKLDDGWFPVTHNEILAYFALCILMTQVKKPNIQMYWSIREVVETPIFGKVMPLKRFTQISRCLHFSNNVTHCNNDRLAKIRPVINYWNEKFNKIYTLNENISIDESLMRYKGRLIYKQFNPSKRARFGLKIYKLCEAKTGFCSKFKIYTGEDKTDITDSASENVVMELAESVVNKGYTLCVDNWYSSPALFLRLLKQKTNVIGTVRKNRKYMPQDLPIDKLKLGEHVQKTCNGLLALRWKDKRDVYMLTTKHASVELTEVRNNQGRTKLKPTCVIDYNKGMGGIDLNDQMLACFPIMRKYLKEEDFPKDPQPFLEPLREQFRQLRPIPTAHHNKCKPFVHKTLHTCTHVFLREDAVQKPLDQPYSGPYQVLERLSDRVFKIATNGKEVTVPTERLKPAHMVQDSAEPAEDFTPGNATNSQYGSQSLKTYSKKTSKTVKFD